MFICWCCLVNIQAERGKDVHMISCLVNRQAERGKDVHMMVLNGEWTSGERQRCSYDGAV